MGILHSEFEGIWAERRDLHLRLKKILHLVSRMECFARSLPPCTRIMSGKTSFARKIANSQYMHVRDDAICSRFGKCRK